MQGKNTSRADGLVAAGFNLCLWKGQLSRRRRLPISLFFFFSAWFLLGQKAGKQATRVQCVKERQFPSTLTFWAAFLYPLLVVGSSISGLLVRQSHCLYQSLGSPLPLLSLPTMKCSTLTVYLIFAGGGGLAGKGHSRISLDHMAATEWSWSHCRRWRRSEPRWTRLWLPKGSANVCGQAQVHL